MKHSPPELRPASDSGAGSGIETFVGCTPLGQMGIASFFVAHKNFRRVAPSIDAHIEALP